jgi:hypothetical protein
VTYYADLSRYEYLPTEQEMINIGWLAGDQDYPSRSVPADVLQALVIMADDQANLTRGLHNCDFCDEESPLIVPAPVEDGHVALGMGELHVEGDKGQIYAAPSLIVHYMSAHQYWPPSEFQEAVLHQAARKYSLDDPRR